MGAFYYPCPGGYLGRPIWDGTQFLIGDSRHRILEYSENFAGWSDNLTALHEESAGDNHPIDVASRLDAISQVEKCNVDGDSIIMEIGCSSGFLIRDLVECFPRSTVIGADVVKEPLYKLAQSLPTVPLLRFDLLKCPLPNDCVDILIMLNVLEHIENDLGALKKAFDLLKPGGILIIEVPAGSSLYDDYDAHLQHFRRYSAEDLINKLKIAGFSIARQSHLGAILFPAFAVVKYLNKLFPEKNTRSVVRERSSKTGSSTLVEWVMKFESKYLSKLKLPFGIRVLASAQKPLE
jgi:SAM-dependent methyltransferase